MKPIIQITSTFRSAVAVIAVLVVASSPVPSCFAELIISIPSVEVPEGSDFATIELLSRGDANDAFNSAVVAFAVADGQRADSPVTEVDTSGTLLGSLSVADSTPAGFASARLLNFTSAPGSTTEVGPNGPLLRFTVATSGLAAGTTLDLTPNFANASQFTDGDGNNIAFRFDSGPGLNQLLVVTAIPEPSSLGFFGCLGITAWMSTRRRERRSVIS